MASQSEHQLALALEELTKKKLDLLEQQKAVADKFHTALTGPNGLNEVSRLTCKNLEAAVAASRRPGSLRYYEPPEEAVKLVKDKELQTLNSKLLKLQTDLQAVEEDLQRAREKLQEIQRQSPQRDVKDLKEWFGTHGSPKPQAPGYLTAFEKNPKIYGGTEHYPAFKSQATVMKKGRLTR